LNPRCSGEELQIGSERNCKIYFEVPDKLDKEGEKTVSVDKKKEIQAIERNALDLPIDYGKTRKREFDYTRRGTQCLIANWNIVNGKIISSTIGETRNEYDFFGYIKKTVQSEESVKKWCFVIDNLNTHQSETLVCWVAGMVNTTELELGRKREVWNFEKQGNPCRIFV
jgi:hypothetical protein